MIMIELTLIVAISLEFIVINRVDASGVLYKSLPNKRAESDPLYITNTRSATECTVRCTNTEGCYQVNWIPPRCELLMNSNGPAVFVNVEQSRYLYITTNEGHTTEAPTSESLTTGVQSNEESTQDTLSCPVTYDLVSDPVYETPSSHLSVSSIYREYDSIGSLIARYGANKSRLTNVGWRARNEQGQHIQAEFLADRIVTGIRTQGHETFLTYTEQYTISTSLDGMEWHNVTAANGEEYVFAGNTDHVSIVTNVLPQPVVARFVRLDVVAFFGSYPSLRWAIDGCPLPTDE